MSEHCWLYMKSDNQKLINQFYNFDIKKGVGKYESHTVTVRKPSFVVAALLDCWKNKLLNVVERLGCLDIVVDPINIDTNKRHPNK